MNREQPVRRAIPNGRRKNTRAANRNKQVTSNTSKPAHDPPEEREQDATSPETNNEKDHDSLAEHSDDEHEDDEQDPMALAKQPGKGRPLEQQSPPPPPPPPLTDEPPAPTKPQASVAPVKQTPCQSYTYYPSYNHPKFSQNYYKGNGYSSASYNVYNTYSTYNTLPPRLQQQRQQREAEFAAQKFRKRRFPLPSQRDTFPPNSAMRSNDFVSASYQEEGDYDDDGGGGDVDGEEQQQQQQPLQESESQTHYVNNEQNNTYAYAAEQQQESFVANGYSSESDVVPDPPLTNGNNPMNALLPTSVGSQSSLQRLDLVRSLATSHGLLDELVSIFDTVSFSSDELDLILNKIAAKHISTKHDLQRLLSSAKSDKTLERILDETYRSQAKILALELQTEKSRVLELTKSNAEMENTIRQFQQQQPNSLVQYQQMVLPYQMQLQRLADENTRLQHQLHGYAMLPATINELKQNQHILTEKIRQMTIRNSALENEVADSERASKHAAEIYKKADAQKQERIEQMIADINKYKKLDKELTALRQKHSELEKSSTAKLDEIGEQRDELQKTCDELKNRAQQYEQIKAKHEQLLKSPPNMSTAKLQEELGTLKAENDQLRQRNWKMVEELNRLLKEQQPS